MKTNFCNYIWATFRQDVTASLAELFVCRYRLHLSQENELKLRTAIPISHRIERAQNMRLCAKTLLGCILDDFSQVEVWNVLRDSPRVKNPILMRTLLFIFNRLNP